MYKCIIFDVDGTLIDTEEAVFKSYQRVIFEELGEYASEAMLLSGYGIPTEKALEIYGLKNIEEAATKYYGYLIENLKEVKPFPGVGKILDAIRERGILTGIVTSRNKLEVEKDSNLQELKGYFNYVVCSEDTIKHKPEGEPLLKFLELSGASAGNAIYIGDTCFDYMCAKNAGIPFALALWGAKNTDGIEAEYLFERPEDILRIL
ncbi:MAG: HAD family hydrolase [Bacillota bacterium]|nr:HAD family hydrolase [Bacillota bacterium]